MVGKYRPFVKGAFFGTPKPHLTSPSVQTAPGATRTWTHPTGSTQPRRAGRVVDDSGLCRLRTICHVDAANLDHLHDDATLNNDDCYEFDDDNGVSFDHLDCR